MDKKKEYMNNLLEQKQIYEKKIEGLLQKTPLDLTEIHHNINMLALIENQIEWRKYISEGKSLDFFRFSKDNILNYKHEILDKYNLPYIFEKVAIVSTKVEDNEEEKEFFSKEVKNGLFISLILLLKDFF